VVKGDRLCGEPCATVLQTLLKHVTQHPNKQNVTHLDSCQERPIKGCRVAITHHFIFSRLASFELSIFSSPKKTTSKTREYHPCHRRLVYHSLKDGLFLGHSRSTYVIFHPIVPAGIPFSTPSPLGSRNFANGRRRKPKVVYAK
jgi:hypothetical protein